MLKKDSLDIIDGDYALEVSTANHLLIKQENTRTHIIYGTGCIVAFLILSLFIGVGSQHIDLIIAKEMFSVIVTPILTLFGSMLGYYFGSKKHNT